VTDVIAHIDGGARGNPGPAAIGIVIRSAGGEILYEEGTAIGRGTNNEAEYRALIRLLEVCASGVAAIPTEAKTLRVHCDSLLIVKQVIGAWKIKEPRLRELYEQVQTVKQGVALALRIKHVPREQNKDADRLVNAALDEEEKKV
jgi:ribonuclease HI